MTLVEAVPNVSEGRRHDVVEKLVNSVQQVPGSRLLDWSSDPSHNRTVLTIAGNPQGLTAALLLLYEVSIDLIDITIHKGEHPRIGIVDFFGSRVEPILATIRAVAVTLVPYTSGPPNFST